MHAILDASDTIRLHCLYSNLMCQVKNVDVIVLIHYLGKKQIFLIKSKLQLNCLLLLSIWHIQFLCNYVRGCEVKTLSL